MDTSTACARRFENFDPAVLLAEHDRENRSIPLHPILEHPNFFTAYTDLRTAPSPMREAFRRAQLAQKN
jgi:hypothetical protein